MEVLGIDIGGSGIKGAIVNVAEGQFVGERFRLDTPVPATPEAVIDTIQQIIDHFQWTGKIGIGYPGVVRSGIIMTAANLEKSWIGVNAAELLKEKSGLDSYWVNDADAAGVAEVKFGTLAQGKNVVVFLTVGTGIGSAIFTQGHLLPNTEFGHLKLKSEIEAEHYASDAARKREEMTWEKWGKRFNRYLETMDALFWPDLFIIGGGISKKFDKYSDKFNVQAPVLPASLLNEAGAIGAAYFAHEQLL